MMTEITMTLKVMKMAFMFTFTYEISSSYALLFHKLYNNFQQRSPC